MAGGDKSALEINDVLLLYCQASWQQINLDKSLILFAKQGLSPDNKR
jgi:hypothetical protein